MFRILFVVITLFFCCTSIGVSAEKMSALQIVRECDQVRNPSKPFRFTETLLEYRKGIPTQKMKLNIYAKEEPSNGQYDSLVQFLEPLNDRGKIMMKNGNDLWFYDPLSKASIRISPKQRLLGQAANGDVVSVNMAKDYTAELQENEQIPDTEKKMRDCYKIQLLATSPAVTYNKILIWIEKDTSIPVKAKFFSESDRLLKIVYYRDMQMVLGRMRPVETIIIDGLDKTLVTKMSNAEYQFADIPDYWFQKDFLPRFTGK